MQSENGESLYSTLTAFRRERWLEITTRATCSVGCAYCPQSKFAEAYRARTAASNMGLRTFRHCLETVPEDVRIIFAGFVEPWLNPECTEMVRWAIKQGHRVSVYTTCVGMTPSDALALRELPLERVHLHVPSDVPRRRSLRVDRYYLDILELMVAGCGESATYHYHEGTGPHPHVAALLDARGLRAVHWAVNTRAGHLANMASLGPASGAVRCAQGREHKNVLLPDGSVALCCMDWGLEHVLGSLIESDYTALFEAEPYLSLRSGMAAGSGARLCRQCEWVESA